MKDGKFIGGGEGRLNDKTINTLQNYYGMAIRQNNEMKKSVAAVVHHCSEAKSMDERHQFCPRKNDSWCKYQADKITGGNIYKVKFSIPECISEILKPIFGHEHLGSEVILKRCLHGGPQNVNESINNVIWQNVQIEFLSV